MLQKLACCYVITQALVDFIRKKGFTTHMFRSVLIIILVIAVLWISRTVLQRLKQTPVSNKPLQNKDTVQCSHCKTYIPVDDAISHNQQYFCSQQHLEDWNQSR